MKRLLFLSLGILFSQVGHAQMTCPAALPADICQFENAVYTSTNFKNTDEVRQMMLQLKALMMTHANDTALIQEHIYTLADSIVEEAYNQRAPKSILALANGKSNLLEMLKQLRPWEAKHGQIVPLDWHLPDGFILGVSSLERSYNVATDRVRYAVSFFSVLDRLLDVEQFQISRYPGAVVIDKAAGIGSWNEGFMPGQDKGKPFVSASSSVQETPLQDGLYLLTIKVKDQNVVNGWFYLHGTAATSPVVLSPQVNEKLHTGTPTFRFQDFKSNAAKITDHQKRAIQVFHEGDNKNVWKAQVVNPGGTTSVTLGNDPNQTGVSALKSGSYHMNLVFEERSFFGDMTVGRFSNTTVPFGISK